MAADRDAQLLALARELERQDADVAARIDTVAGLPRSRRAVRAGSRRVLGALEALPEAVAVAEQSERDALAREAERRDGARRGRAAPRRGQRLPEGERRGEDRSGAGGAGGRRWPRRTRRTPSPGCGSASRRSPRDEVALEAEAEASPSRRSSVAREVAEVPRLSDSGRAAPGASLAEIDEWGARAHAALFVVRGGLESEREKIVVEANALAAAALGEQTAA